MLTARLKIMFRSLWKNRGMSFINLFGLTTGLSAALLIFVYIQQHLVYDQFQEKGDRIARVIMEYAFDGSPQGMTGNFTSTKVAPTYSRIFPEVEKGVRMYDAEAIFRKGDQLLHERAFVYADSSFFDVFQFELVAGNPKKLLQGPYQVVLTETSAHKYFGDENPLGKLLVPASGARPFEVCGVIKDYPQQSQLQFDFLASFSSLGANQEVTYFEANYTTYLLFRSPDAFRTLPDKSEAHVKEVMKGSGATIHFYFEPFLSIHRESPYMAMTSNVSTQYLIMLGVVGGLILLIVCFTYINVSAARSVERAREVGIRKVVGSSRQQIFWQFIAESLLLCTLAAAASFQVATLGLPWFNQLTEETFSVAALYQPGVIIFAIVLCLVVSLLAGAYPAAILSGYKPVKVLKGVFRNSASARQMQQSLIVFQFAISVFLIVCTVMVQRQLYYVQHAEVGFDRSQLLVLPLGRTTVEKSLATLKTELKRIPGVEYTSHCVSGPERIQSGYNMRSAEMSADVNMAVTANPVDEEYIPATGLQLIAGENITEQDVKDAYVESKEGNFHFVLNELAAAQLGWTPQEAIGKVMYLGENRRGVVRGVVRNFHFESMHSPIKPLVLFPEFWGRRLLVKVNTKDMPAMLAQMQGVWKNVVTDMPFEYRFLDEDYNRMYNTEIRLGDIMTLFATLAIVLACLGLFGLSSLVVQQRLKEISIRKVLGASLGNLIMILSGRFTWLVVLSIVIAVPLAAWVMKGWLEGFAYAVGLDIWVFAGASMAALAIAFLTVSIQGVQAALTNPAQTLKSE